MHTEDFDLQGQVPFSCFPFSINYIYFAMSLRILLFVSVPLVAALHAPADSASLRLRGPLNLPSLAKEASRLLPSQLGARPGPASTSEVALILFKQNFLDLIAAARPCQVQALRGGGSTPLGGCIGSLVKNIVGSGVLALAGAVAAFSDEPKMVYPAIAIAFVTGLMSAYCFALVGRTCMLTGAETYREAWIKTMGAGSAWLPSLTCTWKTSVACLCYSIIVGDLGRDLAVTAGLTGQLANREVLLTISTVLLLLPLCLLRSFGFLQYTSLLGIAGTAYTAIFMVLRKSQVGTTSCNEQAVHKSVTHLNANRCLEPRPSCLSLAA